MRKRLLIKPSELRGVNLISKLSSVRQAGKDDFSVLVMVIKPAPKCFCSGLAGQCSMLITQGLHDMSLTLWPSAVQHLGYGTIEP